MRLTIQLNESNRDDLLDLAILERCHPKQLALRLIQEGVDRHRAALNRQRATIALLAISGDDPPHVPV